jgi:hypothetical protein
MSPKPNVEKAHEAGKNGWPHPKKASSHNYHPEEVRAYEAGQKARRG